MNSPSRLDKTYQVIIKRLVETGQAPHYTEIATELGLSVEEARGVLQNLMSEGTKITFQTAGNIWVSGLPHCRKLARNVLSGRQGRINIGFLVERRFFSINNEEKYNMN